MDIAVATILGLVVGALLGALGTGMVRRRQAAEFRALSSQALAASNEQFLQLALTRFGALEDATEADPAFAAQLTELAAEVKKAAGVSASDHGVAAGRDVNVHAESGSVAAVNLYGGVTIGTPPPGANRD